VAGQVYLVEAGLGLQLRDHTIDVRAGAAIGLVTIEVERGWPRTAVAYPRVARSRIGGRACIGSRHQRVVLHRANTIGAVAVAGEDQRRVREAVTVGHGAVHEHQRA
jgi:hypothetical protein